MRIVVILPDAQQLETAGVRIRYRRIQPLLRRLGHVMELKVLDEFDAGTRIDGDTYLFCKSQDARAVILARRFAAAGRLVGVDVFDDYFSQRDDARLVPLRRWWDDMRPFMRFLLCATPSMAQRLTSLAPGVPVHILNDPCEPVDADAMASLVEAKVALARRTGMIEVAWFGMGDNPVFPVGLDDLSAFGVALGDLRATGLQPRLRVLTNRRAMTAARIEGLARLPIPAELDHWSVEAEADLLKSSLVSVLPVNARPFSTVKSLNRAVTALTSGTQVLSLGHPLYEALKPYVYRSVAELLADLAAGRLRLRRETAPGLVAALSESGAPEREARRLATFLGGLPATRGHRASPAAPGVVLHGTTYNGAVNDFSRRQGWLTSAGPFGWCPPDVDVTFTQDDGGAVVAVLSEQAHAALGARDRARCRSCPDRGDVFLLTLTETSLPGFDTTTMAERIVRYPAVLDQVKSLLERVLPGWPVLLSEQAAPFAATLREVQQA